MLAKSVIPNGPYFKVLAYGQKPHHGGYGKWTPGKWRSVRGVLQPCAKGLHYVTLNQLPEWLGPEIWSFEPGRGTEIVHGGDKIVCRRGRITTQYTQWNERTARLFAADCAEHVLPIYEKAYPSDNRPRDAIAVARRFAEGRATQEELAAAWAAAGAAAWAAAGAAAEAAAWDAAWDAAGAAARAAAWAAAWDAARAAAGAAERRWQAQRLAEVLGLEEPPDVV